MDDVKSEKAEAEVPLNGLFCLPIALSIDNF